MDTFFGGPLSKKYSSRSSNTYGGDGFRAASCRRCHTPIIKVNPSNWCLIPVPTYEETSLRSLINSHISTKQERTRAINQLHAFFNLNGISFLKKSDLGDSDRRHDLVDYYFSQDDLRGMQANRVSKKRQKSVNEEAKSGYKYKKIKNKKEWVSERP